MENSRLKPLPELLRPGGGTAFPTADSRVFSLLVFSHFRWIFPQNDPGGGFFFFFSPFQMGKIILGSGDGSVLPTSPWKRLCREYAREETAGKIRGGGR